MGEFAEAIDLVRSCQDQGVIATGRDLLHFSVKSVSDFYWSMAREDTVVAKLSELVVAN